MVVAQEPEKVVGGLNVVVSLGDDVYYLLDYCINYCQFILKYIVITSECPFELIFFYKL